jgi:hypothetical protein
MFSGTSRSARTLTSIAPRRVSTRMKSPGESFFFRMSFGDMKALVAHAMIPVALEEGCSLVVLPTVAGFLFALYLALAESFV